MPEEAWVLKCYSCKKFQVQLKKKAKKWQCKVCGSKQDLITIYFKGRPSDCRVNVQNMNAVEGEMFDKSQEQSTYQDRSYNYDNSENVSQNSQNHNFFSYDMEEYTEEFIAGIDQRCIEVEEINFQETFKMENRSDKSTKNITQENAIAAQSSTNDTELNAKNDKEYFDLNSIDFTIKTENNSVSNNSAKKRNRVLKLSIFESNSDFDESLDF